MAGLKNTKSPSNLAMLSSTVSNSCIKIFQTFSNMKTIIRNGWVNEQYLHHGIQVWMVGVLRIQVWMKWTPNILPGKLKNKIFLSHIQMRQFNILWNSSNVGLLPRWLTGGPDLAACVLECSSNVRREGCSPNEHYCQAEMPFELLTSFVLDPWLPTIASLDVDTLQWKLNRASEI